MVRLIEGMEKWKDERLVGGWKSGRLKNISFSFMCVWLKGWKSGRVENYLVWLEKKGDDENYNLYKLTIMSLLYNI